MLLVVFLPFENIEVLKYIHRKRETRTVGLSVSEGVKTFIFFNHY
jgi:hypothetical protein